MTKQNEKLIEVAKRLSERITSPNELSGYLNQAEQRLLARAFLSLIHGR